MKLLSHIPPFLRNKFVLALVAFIVWMTFFDRNNMLVQFDRYREHKTQLASKSYYEKEIAVIRKESDELSSNAASIEKYAREKYMMKKDNEDVFIVPDPTPGQKNKK